MNTPMNAIWLEQGPKCSNHYEFYQGHPILHVIYVTYIKHVFFYFKCNGFAHYIDYISNLCLEIDLIVYILTRNYIRINKIRHTLVS
jgi:hypothetical protein